MCPLPYILNPSNPHPAKCSPSSAAQELAWTEVAQLRQQVVEQEEQLEQSAKVIRYLQGQVQQHGGAGASGSGGVSKEQLLIEQLEATQDECDELRGQVRTSCVGS